MEGARLSARIATVEPLHAGGQGIEETIIPRHALRGCVRKVGQQNELDLRFRVAEVMPLELFQKEVDLCAAAGEARHDHGGLAVVRDPSLEVELRKDPGRKQLRQQPVDYRDAKHGRGQRRNQERSNPYGGGCPQVGSNAASVEQASARP